MTTFVFQMAIWFSHNLGWVGGYTHSLPVHVAKHIGGLL